MTTKLDLPHEGAKRRQWTTHVGVKDSGWGRSGPQSMADFTEIQWITTRDGTGTYPI